MIPKFYSIKELDGFDPSVKPRWQMVGANLEKKVLLLDGKKLSVKARHQAIAKVVGLMCYKIRGGMRISKVHADMINR